MYTKKLSTSIHILYNIIILVRLWNFQKFYFKKIIQTFEKAYQSKGNLVSCRSELQYCTKLHVYRNAIQHASVCSKGLPCWQWASSMRSVIKVRSLQQSIWFMTNPPPYLWFYLSYWDSYFRTHYFTFLTITMFPLFVNILTLPT